MSSEEKVALWNTRLEWLLDNDDDVIRNYEMNKGGTMRENVNGVENVT